MTGEAGPPPSRFVGSWHLERPSPKAIHLSRRGCAVAAAAAVVVPVLLFYYLGVVGGLAAVAAAIGLAVAILWVWRRRDVAGEHDEAIRQEHNKEMAALVPGAKLVILPGVSRFAMWQKPDEFNQAVLDFLLAK